MWKKIVGGVGNFGRLRSMGAWFVLVVCGCWWPVTLDGHAGSRLKQDSQKLANVVSIIGNK